MSLENTLSEPLSTQHAARDFPQPGLKTAFDLAGKRGVVVEDEGVTQLQLRRILRTAGIEVVGVAANGRDAVEIVRQTKPDFVLMDVRMPVMDGLEATRRILAHERVCIIMLTAFSEEEYQQEAQNIGASGYVLKPITSNTLLPQLAEALRQFTLLNERED
jgi:response regulator NasT